MKNSSKNLLQSVHSEFNFFVLLGNKKKSPVSSSVENLDTCNDVKNDSPSDQAV